MRIEDRFDRMLDQALEMTFPASDPISIYMPTDVSAAKASRREQVLDALPTAA